MKRCAGRWWIDFPISLSRTQAGAFRQLEIPTVKRLLDNAVHHAKDQPLKFVYRNVAVRLGLDLRQSSARSLLQ
jgi:hypothetical protein